MKRSYQVSGFSLLELMIVIAVIAVLTMVAMPNYSRFMAKARRAEAYTNLNSLYAAQKAYWAEHGEYTNQLTGPNGLGWKPDGQCNYCYGFPGSEGVNYVSGKLGNPQALGGGYADKNGFVAIAAADIDGDGVLDIMSINQDHVVSIVQSDI